METAHHLSHLELHSVLDHSCLLLLFALPVDVSPAAEAFDSSSAVVISRRLLHLDLNHFFRDFVLVEQSEGPRKVLGDFYALVEFGNMAGHEFNLHGLLLRFCCEGAQFLLG